MIPTLSASVLEWQASLLQPTASQNTRWPDSQRQAPWWLLRHVLLDEHPHPLWASVRSIALSAPGLTDAVIQRAVEQGAFDRITHLQIASQVLSWDTIARIFSRAPIHHLDIRSLQGDWGPFSGGALSHLSVNLRQSGALRHLLEQDACQDLSALSVFFLAPTSSEWWSAPILRRLSGLHLRGDPGAGFCGQNSERLSAFSFTQAGAPDWLPAVRFSQLERLSLSRSQISDALLVQLGSKPWFGRLRALDISYTPVSSSGTRWLHRPDALTHIDLSGTRIAARALDTITRGCPIHVARLANGRCSAGAIDRLLTANAKTLRRIDVSGTAAPAGLLSGEQLFPALHTVSASNTALCANDFHSALTMQRFPALHSLDLGYCSLDGECDASASSSALKNLWLSGTTIGESATRLLSEAALPSLQLLDLSLARFGPSPAAALTRRASQKLHTLVLSFDHQWSSDEIVSVLDAAAPHLLTLTAESTGAMASESVYRWLANTRLPYLQELDLSRLDASADHPWPDADMAHLSSLWVIMASMEQLSQFATRPLAQRLRQLTIFGSPPLPVEESESLFSGYPAHVTIL